MKNKYINNLKLGFVGFLLNVCSLQIYALTPSFTVLQEIDFGIVLPEPGSCRMIASTGAIVSFSGTNICILPEDSQNGRYSIVGDPNIVYRVKVLPDQDNGDNIVFNPYIELVSDGFVKVIISNNVGYKIIDSGPDGIVDLYLGGDLVLDTTFSSNQTFIFSFVDAIEWSENP
jgi:hypothetical protein